MPLNPLNGHYAMENPLACTVYDEEAMTALQLSGRLNGKVNELVKSFNTLEHDTVEHLEQQDKEIPEKVTAEFQKNMNNGAFETMIDTYAGNLETRMDNMLGTMTPGISTGDAEVYDIRVGNNNRTYTSAGTAVREQFNSYVEDYGDVTGLNLVKCGQIISGAWVNESGEIIENTDSKYVVCKLRSQKDVTIWAGPSAPNMYATQFGGVAFLNSAGNVVSVVDAYAYQKAQKDGYYFAEIPVPTNAVSVMCTLKLGTTWDATGDLIITQGSLNELDNPTVSAIGGYKIVGDELTDVELMKHCTVNGANLAKLGTIHTGAWINQDGEILYTPTSNYIEFPVTGGEILNFCLGLSGVEMVSTQFGGMVFLNQNMEKVSIVAVENYRVSELFNGCECATIPVPSNATLCRCTIKLATTWDATETMTASHYSWSNMGNPCVTHIAGTPLYSPVVSPWSNLTWAVVGDSLTEHNTRTNKNYHDYVAEKTGITVVNMGASGTGYKRSEEENKAFYQRIGSVPATADVVTIFGSGNDMTHISSLGTATDTGTSTICGCINTTIDNLYEALPTVQLGIVSPTPWVNNTPEDNGTMAQYTEKLREICERRGIPFLDLFHCSGLRPNDETFRSLCYSKDAGNGVHPDENGHKLIASRFYQFLQGLIGIY